jgi:hypothetical protein
MRDDLALKVFAGRRDINSFATICRYRVFKGCLREGNQLQISDLSSVFITLLIEVSKLFGSSGENNE